MVETAMQAEIQQRVEALRVSGIAPLVVICLPTFNPPLSLLQRQLASIRAQTHTQWLCLISDDASTPEHLAALKQLLAEDARFVLAATSQRLGVYHNLERCLKLVPAAADFVALADQDDFWYPDKLARLLAAFRPKTKLVYSDLRVVNEAGQVLSESYWTTWRNNQTDLTELLFENTVTGAAALFRCELLRVALPFPGRVGNLYHDHWLACVALALGEVEFLAEPLYDYIQHGGNNVGYFSPPRSSWLALTRTAMQRLIAASGAQLAHIYEEKVLKPRDIARTILKQTAGTLPATKRAELERLAAIDNSWRKMGWLLVRGLRKLRHPSVGLPAEHYAAAALLWRRWQARQVNSPP
jgi:glycosyltransferase involved in cell wall biosynthesis